MGRYIKDDDVKNMFKGYENKHFRLLIKDIAKKYGFIKDEQIEYRRTKVFICDFIRKHYNIQDVSIRQISKLEKPQKNMCSKYAPVYLIAIYTILYKTDMTTILNLLTEKEKKLTYPDFSLGKILIMVNQLAERRLDCSEILLFNRNLDLINRRIPQIISILFSNDFQRPFINDEEVIRK